VQTVHWQGEAIVLRPIRPEDEPQHRAFIERLQPQDLRLRFFGARRELPRSELARLTQIDYAREMAFIAIRTLPDGTAQTLGVVRAVIDPDNIDAEFAIIVRSDLKGQGLGHLLLSRLIEFLASRGTQRLVGDVLHENESMRQLAASKGFVLDAASSNTDALRYVLELPRRAPARAVSTTGESAA
jgi:acetyltransferase